MTELVEKRGVPRHAIKLPFLYRLKTPISVTRGAGWTHNLSEEGGCLELSDRLEESSAIQLLFQTDHGGLSLGAKVVWIATIRERGVGVLHGVVFPELNADKRQALREFLQSGD